MPIYVRDLSVEQLERTRAYHWQRVEKSKSEGVKTRERNRIRIIDAELERRRHVQTAPRKADRCTPSPDTPSSPRS